MDKFKLVTLLNFFSYFSNICSVLRFCAVILCFVIIVLFKIVPHVGWIVSSILLLFFFYVKMLHTAEAGLNVS